MTDELEKVRAEAAENGWRITGPDENGEYYVGEDDSGWCVGQIVTMQTTRFDRMDTEYGAVHAGDGRSPVMRATLLEAWRDLCAYHPDGLPAKEPDLCLVCGVDIGDGGTVHVVKHGDGTIDDRLPFCAAHADGYPS